MDALGPRVIQASLRSATLVFFRGGVLFRRQGKAVTNFEQSLPLPQSDLAQQITKDPYNFDFLLLGPEAHERGLERGLLDYLRKFLLELGVGFAFVGSQYPIQVGEEDFSSIYSSIT